MSGTAILAGFTALISLAVVAVILSQNAQTDKVITALGGAVSQSIGAAVSPVTGSNQSSG